MDSNRDRTRYKVRLQHRTQLAEATNKDKLQHLTDLLAALAGEVKALTYAEAFPYLSDHAIRWAGGRIDFQDAVNRFQIHLIKLALTQTDGNRAEAARLLGLKPTTFYSMLKLYKIDAPRNQRRADARSTI